MGKVEKIIIAVALFSLVFGLVSISDASSDVAVTELSHIFDGGLNWSNDYVASSGNIENRSMTPVRANLDICFYGIASYTGNLELENTGIENITVVVVVCVDSNRTLDKEIALNIEHFRGFRIRTTETVEFDVPCKEGNHEVNATIIIDNITLLANTSYMAHGCMDDIDEEVNEIEEVEDWLKCP